MRLRLKLCDKSSQRSSTTVHVNDDCTLSELHLQVRKDVVKTDSSGPDFRLSLNKKDELLGSPEASLKSLGLRSGDLLWVMTDVIGPSASPAEDSICQEPSSSQAEITSGAPALETDVEQQNLSMTFNTSSPLEALRLLIHAAVLDSGLNVLQEFTTAAASAFFASELQYAIRASPAEGQRTPRAACSVRYVNFGNSLVVWGSTASGTMRHISIAAADHICSQPAGEYAAESGSGSEPVLCAKDISGLYMRLKDSFIHPILIALCAEEGRPPPPSMQLLPTELKLLCLQHLHARDLAVLACVSRDMRHMASSDALWEPIFKAEFGAPLPADGLLLGAGAFMRAFGAQWAERERRRRQRRRLVHDPTLPYPGTGPHLVVPHPFFPAGAVGGDYDRLPQPFLGFSGVRSGGGVLGGPSFGFMGSTRRPCWRGLS